MIFVSNPNGIEGTSDGLPALNPLLAAMTS
jgi:hypothetical protein